MNISSITPAKERPVHGSSLKSRDSPPVTRSATRKFNAAEAAKEPIPRKRSQSRTKGHGDIVPTPTDMSTAAWDDDDVHAQSQILTRSRSRGTFNGRNVGLMFSDRPSELKVKPARDRSRASSVAPSQQRSRPSSLTPRQSLSVFKRKFMLEDIDNASLKSQPRSQETTPSSRATRRRRKMSASASQSSLEDSGRKGHVEYNTDSSERRQSGPITQHESIDIQSHDEDEPMEHDIITLNQSFTDKSSRHRIGLTPLKPIAIKAKAFAFDSEDDLVLRPSVFTRTRFQSAGAFSVFGAQSVESGLPLNIPATSNAFTSIRADGSTYSDDEEMFWNSPPAKMRPNSAKSTTSSATASRSSSKRSSPVTVLHRSLKPKLSLEILPRSAPSSSARNRTSSTCENWWMVGLPASGDVVASRKNLFGLFRNELSVSNNKSRSKKVAVATGSPGCQWRVSELANWMEGQGINSPVSRASYHPLELAEHVRQKLIEEISVDEDIESDTFPENAIVSDVKKDEILGRFPAHIVSQILKQVFAVGQAEALLPSLSVSKSWGRIAQQILWSSPRFFSLNAMKKMHRIIHGLTAPVSNDAADLQHDHTLTTSSSDVGGLRGMLGMPHADTEDPKCFLFNPKPDDDAFSSGCSTPCLGLANPMLASRVQSLSFHLFNPGDRRFPISFDVQSFISDGLPCLRELKVMGSPDWVDSFLLSRMASSPALRQNLEVLELHAGAAEKISKDAMVVHLGRFRNLKRLVLGGSWALTDEALKSVAIGCKNLLTLALWRCPTITDVGVVKIIEKCKDLRTLEIGHCNGISDRLIFAMASTESLALHTLSLCSLLPSQVSQDALISLLAPAGNAPGPRLTKLVLNAFPGLTLDGIALIATRQSSSLRYLTLHDSLNLCGESPGALRIFFGFLSHIRLLDVSGCFSACSSEWERKEKIDDLKGLARALGIEGALTT
ncbi:hypothetical protein HDU67_000899 [Dinochytrium kinnereticum]|nr:hypothetical protein HDU67_000899 [Dinochytrium kinnereticum]